MGGSMTEPFDPRLLDKRNPRFVEEMQKLDIKLGWIAGGVILLVLLFLIFGGIKSSLNTALRRNSVGLMMTGTTSQ
jgi:hypothetical protein